MPPKTAATRSRPSRRRASFSRIASAVSHATGRPLAFIAAASAIALWAVTGPIFGFSDTWQLVINTGTTIVTFLMVFLIQNTQNRDTIALELKMDEILRATEGAHNGLLNLEELTEDELVQVREAYIRLATMARVDLTDVFGKIGIPEVAEEVEAAVQNAAEASEDGTGTLPDARRAS
jgi:low affinity Fe/Cu permease